MELRVQSLEILSTSLSMKVVSKDEDKDKPADMKASYNDRIVVVDRFGICRYQDTV